MLHAEVWESISRRVAILYKKRISLSEWNRCWRRTPISDFPHSSAVNIMWRHIYSWERFVRRMGTLSLAALLVLFDKSRVVPALVFPFIHFHFTFITQYIRILSHTLNLDFLSHLQMHIILWCGSPKWCRHTNWASLLPLTAEKWNQNAKDVKSLH